MFRIDRAVMLLAWTVAACACLGTAAVATAAAAVEGQGSAASAADAGMPGAFFFESFGPGWQDRWHYSSVKKYQGTFETVQPHGYQDTAIQMPAGNLHYGMTAQLPEPLLPANGIVVQYEVQFSQGHTCGGAYLKLLSQTEKEFKPKRLKSKTPFSIMFGPDRCGPDSRVHVILNTLNPATQEVTEHHLMSAPAPIGDKLSHLYALVLYQDHRYKVLIDGNERASGLLTAAHFSPPLQPPAELPDPEHVKPEDWVEEDEIDDPAVVKPPDWDDRRLIPNPNAQKPHGWLDALPARVADPAASKPDSWDDVKDGEWLRPSIPNPACEGAPGCGPWKPPLMKNPNYRGPWIAPRIKNPAYQGPWKQRSMPNPAYFKADAPLALLAPIVGVAFELWVTEPGYTFDSVLLGRGRQGLDAAAAYARQVWRPRHAAQEAAAAMAAAAQEASRPSGLLHWPSNMLLGLINSRMLAAFEHQLKPVAQWLQRWPVLLGWLVTLVLLLVQLGLANCVLHGRKRGGSATDAACAQEEDEAAVADEEHRAFIENLTRERKAAKLKAAEQPSASKAVAAAADNAAAVPAAAVTGTQRRRSTRQQQHHEEEGVGLQTPGAQQQQHERQSGSPEDGHTLARTRSTRRSTRQA